MTFTAQADGRPDASWWRNAVVYQVYPRSFVDDSGDGIGDLRGILSRTEYLEWLGVDAVWMSPFYPSALVDGGYDIDDYRDIDPTIGTLEEFDRLVADLHRRGLKVIVDIVPNHSSDRHVWFQEALSAAPGSPARDRYIFRDGRGVNGDEPPSDWSSFFGGPAWTRVPDGQWYLHLFTKEQPDWNWNSREVRDDFLATLRFWADRGVDGFRIDVAHLLAKDLPSELPSWGAMMRPGGAGEERGGYPLGQHPIWDRDELDDIYAEWRALFNSYSPPLMAVAEAWVSPARRVRYASADSLGQSFSFDLLQAEWDAAQVRSIVTENLALAQQSGASSTWVLSNHDVVRHATRFALPDGMAGTQWLLEGADPALENRELGLKRARAMTMLAFALPGSMYIYQGEELGLPEVGDIPDEDREDPAFFRNRGKDIGRDGSRVPLPWTSSPPFFGFSSGGSHLPQPAWFADFAVDVEADDPGSTLRFYREALSLRRRFADDEALEWREHEGDVLSFVRAGGVVSITNLSEAPVELPAGEVILASWPLDAQGMLPPDTTAWVATA